jgi:hypothetical protein
VSALTDFISTSTLVKSISYVESSISTEIESANAPGITDITVNIANASIIFGNNPR